MWGRGVHRARRVAGRVVRRSRAEADPGVRGRLASLEDRALASALAPVVRHQAENEAPVLAVLSDAPDHPLVEAARVVWPQARIAVVDPGEGQSATHVALAAAGRFDGIWDVVDERQAARAREVVFHLAWGGVLVVVGAVTQGPAAGPGALERSRGLAALGATALRAALAPEAEPSADDVRLGELIGAVAVRAGHLVLVARPSGRVIRAKLREEEAGAYLAATGGRVGRVVLERPGAVLENPAPVRVSESDAAPVYRTRFPAPPLQLREYAGATCQMGQVVTTANVVLPDSYRHNFKPRLTNRFLPEIAPRFACTRAPGRGLEDLPGSWFHLDSEFRGHFGHATTEQISRLWAWDEAKARYPDLKALLIVSRHRRTLYDWERRLYQAAGVPPEDLVLFDHSVRPERLLAATPMFSQPGYVHPGIAEIYHRVGADLAAEAPQRDYPERIFCSRRHEKRAATNTAEIEQFFAERGFQVIYPEDYPLAEQVQMFRAASDIAGFAGSAMFSLAFVEEPKRVFLVTPETYAAQNELLMAAVHGHQLNVAWCRPEALRPDGTPYPKRLHTDFTFDAAREGQFLREILDA